MLIDQLRADFVATNGGKDRGWQSAIAEKLGISQPFLSRMASREREVGVLPLELAIRKFGVAPAFFFSSFPKPPNYRDFLGVRKLAPQMGYAAFNEFIEKAQGMGLTISEAERLLLSRQDWETEPTIAAYMHLLSALRACAPREDTRSRRKVSSVD
jgi:hypothetical protein